MPATGDSLSMDDYRRIIKTVIENSSKESWWYNWSKLTAHSHLFRASYVDADGQTKLSSESYRMATDEQVQRLCEKAVETAEDYAENLSEHIAELETEVAKGRLLAEEYRAIVNYGPSSSEMDEKLTKWKSDHDGFSLSEFYENEFIFGYLRGYLKERSLTQKVEPEPSTETEKDEESEQTIIPTLMPPRSIRKAEIEGYLEYVEAYGKYVNQKKSLRELVQNNNRNKTGNDRLTQHDVREYVVKKNGKPYGDSTISEAFN